MTKIAVMTDIHANLPALRAALADIHTQGVDALYHTGDAIGIGPYPAECLEELLGQPQVTCLMGNHDAWFVHGLPAPQPDWMSDGEVAHQKWTHRQIDDVFRLMMVQWPYVLHRDFDGVSVTFVHYGLQLNSRDFQAVVRQPTAADLDEIYGRIPGSLLFFGHDHSSTDVRGQARYLNPGSLGCHREATARYYLLTCQKGHYTLEKRVVPYDDRPLFAAYVKRRVPERQFLCRVFHGNRRPLLE